MAFNFPAFGSAVSGLGELGSAASVLFGGGNDQFKTQGAAYKEAAKYAEMNIAVAESSMNVQMAAAQREFARTLGGQRATIAANGFGEAGTAVDLMRDTVVQGALSQEMLKVQGELNKLSYDEQSKQYLAEAKAADEAAAANTQGSIFKGLAGVAQLGASLFALFA